MSVSHIKVPAGGSKIVAGQPIPNNPIIPYIEGDGIGIDITPVMQAVVDAAVKKAYGGSRQIHWMEVFAGEKATTIYGSDVWLPEETVAVCKEYSVSIKGPMTTPVGGGIRSLNVALRQEMDLYQCVRPVRYFRGVPSPLKDPTTGGSSFPGRRLSVLADARVVAWRLTYPPDYFRVVSSDGIPVLTTDDPDVDWTIHPLISIGLGWNF